MKTKSQSDGRDWFGFVRQCQCPAILCEFAFVDTKDMYIVDSPEEQRAMGIAAAKGILKTLGIAWKAPASNNRGKWCVGNFNENTKNRADVKIHLDAIKKIGYAVWYEQLK